MSKVRVKILRDTVADGQRVKEGQIITIPADDATILINMGRAKKAPAPAKKEPAKKDGDGDGGKGGGGKPPD